MFVRYRQTESRLQVSLIETRRVDGKVRHEHIASFGSVEVPPSVEDRIAFWQRLHERLAKLSNRLDAASQEKIIGDAFRWSRSTSSDTSKILPKRQVEKRHFPLPWSVEELDSCFVVKDLNGQALASCISKKEPRHRYHRSEMLTRDEARRIAAIFDQAAGVAKSGPDRHYLCIGGLPLSDIRRLPTYSGALPSSP